MKNDVIVKKLSEKETIYINAVSVKGLYKDENQDYYSVGYIDSCKASFIAVADGLGSCKNSRQGAIMITQLISEWVRDDLSKYQKLSLNVSNILNKKVLERWYNKLQEENMDEFDTTIHYAIYYNDSILIGGIGDGMSIATIDNNENLNFIAEKDMFGNVTKSILSNGSINMNVEIIDMCNVKEKIAIVLATDGIAEDVFPEKRLILPQYFYEAIKSNGIESLQSEIIDWLNSWGTDGHNDDKTICNMIIDKVGV